MEKLTLAKREPDIDNTASLRRFGRARYWSNWFSKIKLKCRLEFLSWKVYIDRIAGSYINRFTYRNYISNNPKVIALVGNGEISPSLSNEIDAADLIVRFNRADSCGVSGKKTHILVLVNWAHPGKQFKDHPKCINKVARVGAHEFLLTSHPNDIPCLLSGRDAHSSGDATPSILKYIVKGRRVSFMPLSNRRQTECLLREYGSRTDVIPSTGAQAVLYFRTKYPAAQLRCYGFSHHGWGGHDWEAERAWISSVLSCQSHEKLT